MKPGSSIGRTTGSNGNVTLSIGASSAFAKVASTLGIRLTVAVDAHAVKDSISRVFGIDRMYSVYYSNTKIDPHTALAMLMTTSEVECGSVRYLFPVSKTTNDPLLGEEYALTKMNVFSAWDSTFGDTSIVIADVDCAINIDHVDLKGEIKYNWGEIGTDNNGHNKETNGIDDDSDGYIDNWEGWDFCGDVDVESGAALQPNNNPRPREDGSSHGTHTAGCILATGNNGIGIAGVAFGCRLIPIKAAGSDYDNISAGYEGIHYAATHGAKIVNCSWGGFVTAADTAYENAFLNEAIARNMLVVAAAGNNSTTNDGTLEYPADGPGVLSVGATDNNDQPANFSDFGTSVSVWAPGVNIESCDYPGNSAYSSEDGTSFASPLTSGAAGLLWSLHPDWLPKFIAAQLIATCDDVVDPNDQPDYWGRINIGNALTTAPSEPGLEITGYALDGVSSDSLGVNHTFDLKVTFKNVLGAGSNLTATPIASLGSALSTSAVSLGSMQESASANGDFQITRTGVYSQGNLPVRFAVTDGNLYSDTLTLFLPLTVQPGFIFEQGGIYGTSICRVSNTCAWAAFGEAVTDPNTGTAIINNAQFALETGSVWSDTATLGDGSNPPYDVTALDSNTAYFGSGPATSGASTGGTASVIHTADGGKTFDTVSVASFAAFVNTIHFFDPLNGILIGDPVSSKWGIGITSDGGNSWHTLSKTVVASGTIASWNNATAWVGDNGWFGTNSRQILRTTNRGQSWTVVKTGTNQNSLSVAFANDAKHGLACYQPVSGNGNSAMTVSSDSGASWQLLTTLPVANMMPASVQFIPNSTIAILTSNVGVYRTTDYGTTWTPIGIPVSYLAAGADLSISRGNGEFVVSLNSPNNGIATYQEPMADTILQAVTPEVNIPLSVEVYPNPAHGSAIVALNLPANGYTKMTLFDALGRNVLTPFDGELSSGSHQITLDTKSLPPGAYYLDIVSGGEAHVTRTITILP
jgi:photosystem II stability/assembly factor-like uncharacterized protein